MPASLFGCISKAIYLTPDRACNAFTQWLWLWFFFRRFASESWRLSRRSRSKCRMLRLFKTLKFLKKPQRWHVTKIDTIDAMDTIEAMDAIDAMDAMDAMDAIDTMNSQARGSWSLLAPRCWCLGSLVPGWVRNSARERFGWNRLA